MNKNISPVVAIDIGPCERKSAAGTSRLVYEQSKALFNMDVDWKWLPIVRSLENPLLAQKNLLDPVCINQKSVVIRETFSVVPSLLRHNPDLIFLPGCVVPLIHIPVIANFFDSNIFEHGWTWIKSGRRFSLYILKILNLYSLIKSRYLFINSDYCRNYMVKVFPWTNGKFVTNYCGLSELPQPCNKRPDWAISINKPFFLFVGAMSENKNQIRLIEAFKKLQIDHTDLPALVLVGPQDEPYRDRSILPLVSSAARKDDIVLTGPIPDEQLSWAYQNCFAYVQPSIAEGFNLCVHEAMRFGKAVACANTTSHPEEIGDAGLMFDPFSVESIISAILAIWKNADLRVEFENRGRKRCQLFTWSKNAQKVAQYIDLSLRDTYRGRN